MAHFDANSPLRTHRTAKYGSFAMLDLTPNCTHIQNSLKQEIQ
jgi:hypothetical protein